MVWVWPFLAGLFPKEFSQFTSSVCTISTFPLVLMFSSCLDSSHLCLYHSIFPLNLFRWLSWSRLSWVCNVRWLPSEEATAYELSVKGYLNASDNTQPLLILPNWIKPLYRKVLIHIFSLTSFIPFQNCFSKLHFLYPWLYLYCFHVLKSNMLISYRFFKRTTNCNTSGKIFLISSKKELKIKSNYVYKQIFIICILTI